MWHMAQPLETEVATTVHNLKEKILGYLHSECPGIIAFPMLEGLNVIQELWQNLATSQATSCHIEPVFTLYGAGPKSGPFCY